MSRKIAPEVAQERIGAALAQQNGSLLGHIVWSDVELAGHLVDRREVRAALLAAQLPPDIQAESKSVEWAFGRAVSAWRSVTPKAFELRREEKRSDRVLVVDDIGKGLDYASSAKAVCWAAATRVEHEIKAGLDSHVEQLVERDLARLRKLTDRYSHFMDAAEFQQTIRVAILDWFGGTRLRRHGSVYWMPARSSDHLSRLVTIVEQTGKCVLPALPVSDANSAKDRLGRPLASAFERELTDLFLEMRDLAKSPKDTRANTWVARRDQLQTIAGRVQVAEEILGSRVSQLRGLMTAINAAATQAIAEDFAWANDPQFESIEPAKAPDDGSLQWNDE